MSVRLLAGGTSAVPAGRALASVACARLASTARLNSGSVMVTAPRVTVTARAFASAFADVTAAVTSRPLTLRRRGRLLELHHGAGCITHVASRSGVERTRERVPGGEGSTQEPTVETAPHAPPHQRTLCQRSRSVRIHRQMQPWVQGVRLLLFSRNWPCHPPLRPLPPVSSDSVAFTLSCMR